MNIKATVKEINTCIIFSEMIMSRGLISILKKSPKYSFNITDIFIDSCVTFENPGYDLLIIEKSPDKPFEYYQDWYHSIPRVIWMIDIHADMHCIYSMKSKHNALLTKNIKKREFNKALDMVIAGKKYYSDAILKKVGLVQQFVNNNKDLTRRELQVLRYVATGFSNIEISRLLSIGKKTVESHRYNAMKKIKVRNVSEVIKYMYQNELLE